MKTILIRLVGNNLLSVKLTIFINYLRNFLNCKLQIVPSNELEIRTTVNRLQ